MIKKSLQTLTLTTLACSLLSGCVSYRNAEGLPTWLEHGSKANQIAYFMGLKLEDSRAPKGYDPTKNTLVTDVSVSAVTHGVNAATGAMDIGSFGVELGLSLATNLLKHEEEEYNQALMYFPAEAYPTKKEASDAAMKQLADHLERAIAPLGYKTYKQSAFTVWGIKHQALWIENDKVGCHNKDDERCFLYVKFDEDWMRDKPFVEATYLKLPFAPAWRVPHLRVTYHAPKGSSFESDMPNVYNALAKDLPANTWFYAAPMWLNKRWTVPYISDGTNAYFFIKPEAPKP